ncbi:hypothetical protein ACPPVU_09475 [Mucilaginibacter sp. McL0603]|uniref:hypothetical protein n=1 Tax=Mucilaginibacter sp. McL0603 TaxID=3415670 RepID=UPI003CF425A5
MKTLMFIFCISLLVVIGCKKANENLYQSEGVITGYDYRMCAICGGLEINIKNDTSKNPPPFYEINSSLAQLGISENTKFPMNVSLNWKHDTGVLGSYHYITVSKIMVIK